MMNPYYLIKLPYLGCTDDKNRSNTKISSIPRDSRGNNCAEANPLADIEPPQVEEADSQAADEEGFRA